MNPLRNLLLIFSLTFLFNDILFAQNELANKKPIYSQHSDSSIYNPRKAIVHSAVIPGWGQITNKKYWKVPLVYGALGTTAFLFFRNIRQYNDAKNAYKLAIDNDPLNDYLIKQPYFSVKDQPERIRIFRNQVRQNVDYCVLFFIAFWGLNIADAAVDAHLKTFDVNDNLSLYFKPGHSQLSNTNGISLIMSIK
jgi:hypothetical protein